MQRRVAALRRYFAWAVVRGLVPTDPTAGLTVPTSPSRLPRVLKADELTVLLEEPPPAPPHIQFRDDAVLELLYGSGLRVSEERFRQLAENIQDALFVIAGDLSRTLYMSPAYARIWGRSSSDLMSVDMTAALRPMLRENK